MRIEIKIIVKSSSSREPKTLKESKDCDKFPIFRGHDIPRSLLAFLSTDSGVEFEAIFAILTTN